MEEEEEEEKTFDCTCIYNQMKKERNKIVHKYVK